MSQTLVRLPDGVAEGVSEAGVRRFYSLPYAAPLIEARRFKAPQPVESWSGVRDSTRPGPCAPQSARPPVSELDVEALMGTPGPEGGDYLTLNVFAPEEPQSPGPVMVFVHGGSFVAGSKDAPVYDGRAFARNGAVCVVINYRLGIEGFLPLEDGPTNLGLRDMIAALHWVQANIHLFGGDPKRVTLFGESGGAYCTAALMTSPLTKGLFHRAICQSGHIYVSRDRAIMERVRARLAKRLRIKPDRAGFLSIPVDKMLAAQAWVMMPSFFLDMRDSQGRDPSFGITRFLPVHGDDVLPKPAMEALAGGAGREVDLLIGTNSEEANIFFAPNHGREKINAWIARLFMGRALPRAGALLAAYGLNEKGEKAGWVLSRALTDAMFRVMVRRTAELHQGRSWVYEFEWRSPALNGEFGAAHALELPFVFNTLASARGPRGIAGPNPPQELADFMQKLWVDFAATGEAPWQAFDTVGREVYSLLNKTAAYEQPMPAAPFLP